MELNPERLPGAERIRQKSNRGLQKVESLGRGRTSDKECHLKRQPQAPTQVLGVVIRNRWSGSGSAQGRSNLRQKFFISNLKQLPGTLVRKKMDEIVWEALLIACVNQERMRV